ncbi:hypothetical protein EVAR_88882_1 [Eumeta japonica]|uniref:Uncharacterized protein n=1 Tax=Eumeta variegata TaxID=151549 RepID=A0A4C1XXD8_EUMVA|nr:hypothetical protein EVAR_88882_1 [Eumeta japonica]
MDDKARVPLRITATNARAPILMHLDYRVKLPDHDFVVAEKQTYSLCLCRRAREVLCLGEDDDAVWYDEIDVDTTNVPDIKNPNENKVAALAVVNNLKK